MWFSALIICHLFSAKKKSEETKGCSGSLFWESAVFLVCTLLLLGFSEAYKPCMLHPYTSSILFLYQLSLLHSWFSENMWVIKVSTENWKPSFHPAFPWVYICSKRSCFMAKGCTRQDYLDTAVSWASFTNFAVSFFILQRLPMHSTPSTSGHYGDWLRIVNTVAG